MRYFFRGLLFAMCLLVIACAQAKQSATKVPLAASVPPECADLAGFDPGDPDSAARSVRYNDCVMNSLVEANKNLYAKFEELRKSVSEENRGPLIFMQRDWEAESNSACTLKHRSSLGPELGCKIKAVKARAQLIQIVMDVCTSDACRMEKLRSKA